jgi:hypothetical protein
MMQHQWIKIAGKTFAVEHIAVILEVGNGTVRVWTVADAEPWEFRAEEAKALAAWAKTLPCQDLMQERTSDK